MSFASLSESIQTVTQPFSPNTKVIYQNPKLINPNAIHGDAIVISDGLAYFIRNHQFLSQPAAGKNDTVSLMNHKTVALTVVVDTTSIKKFLSDLSALTIRYEYADKRAEILNKQMAKTVEEHERAEILEKHAARIVEELRTHIWLEMRSPIKELMKIPEIKQAAIVPITNLKKLISLEPSEKTVNQIEAVIQDIQNIVALLPDTDSAKSITSEKNAAFTLIKAIRGKTKLITDIPIMFATRKANKEKEYNAFKIAIKKNEIFPLIFYQILQIINTISPEEITIDNYRGILAGAYTLCMKYNPDPPIFTSGIADQLKIERGLLCQYECTVAELIDFKIPHEDALLDELIGNKEISFALKTILQIINPQNIIPRTPAMIPILIPAIIQQLENKENLLLIQEINSRLASLQRQNDLTALLGPKSFFQSLFEKKELPEDQLHRFLLSAQTPADFQSCLKAMLDYFNKASSALPLKSADIELIIFNAIDNPVLIQHFLEKILIDKQPHLTDALIACFQTETANEIIFSALDAAPPFPLARMLFDLLITIEQPAQNETLVKLAVLDSTGDCARTYLEKFPSDTASLGMIAIAHADKRLILLHIKSVISFDQFHPDDLIALFLKLDELSTKYPHTRSHLSTFLKPEILKKMLSSTNIEHLTILLGNDPFRIIIENNLEVFCIEIIKQNIAKQLSLPLLNIKALSNYAELLEAILAPMIYETKRPDNVGLLISQHNLISEKIREDLPVEHPYIRELNEKSVLLGNYLTKNSFLQTKKPSSETVSPPSPQDKTPLKPEI